jgi:DinB superfamily
LRHNATGFNVIAEVLNSYALNLDYLRRLIKDVPDDRLADQPGGVVNHPLWTIRHLVYSAQMIGTETGLPAWLSDEWQTRYGTGSVPSAERSAYPSRNQLLIELAEAERRLKEHLQAMGDGPMQQPLPDVRYRRIFPTLGHAVTHILTAHTAAHIGQVVWRRVAGFPPLSKVFD